MTTITVKSTTGTEIKLTMSASNITAEARGTNLGGVQFDGKNIRTSFAVNVGGKMSMITMPVADSDLAAVKALFQALSEVVAAHIGFEMGWADREAGIKKMMNA